MDTDRTEVLDPLPPTAAPSVPQTYRMLLRRNSTDKMLGGVCGGVARRYGFDPALLRVATVVAVFAGGLGLLGYAAAWLLIPADSDRTDSTLTRSLGRLIFGVLFALAAVAGVVGWLGSLGGLSGVIVGGFVVGVAAWLFLRQPTTGAAADPSPPQDALAVPPPMLAAPQVTAAGFAYGGLGATTADVPWDATVADQPRYYAPPPPREPRERSYLGANVLLAAVMVMGLMGAGAAAGLFPLSPTVFFAVPLAVVAAGLLVGAFMGRARWLILPAVVLALITAATVPAAQFVNSMEGGLGSPVWQPTAATSYDLGVGSATLDLTTWADNTGVPRPTEASTVSAAVQVGELQVIVPETWRVKVAADVNAGDLSINNELVGPGRPGVTADDEGVTFEGVLSPVGDAAATVTLDLEAGLGAISIVQVPLNRGLDSPLPTVSPTPGAQVGSAAPTSPASPAAAASPPTANPATPAPLTTPEAQS